MPCTYLSIGALEVWIGDEDYDGGTKPGRIGTRIRGTKRASRKRITKDKDEVIKKGRQKLRIARENRST